MNNWIVIGICIGVICILHALSILLNNKILRYTTLAVHALMLVMLLIVEATLTQLFIFMLSSIAFFFIMFDIKTNIDRRKNL